MLLLILLSSYGCGNWIPLLIPLFALCLILAFIDIFVAGRRRSRSIHIGEWEAANQFLEETNGRPIIYESQKN